MKTWSASDIRALARQTVDGRRAITTARGEYLKALVGTAQAEIGDNKLDQAGQRKVVSDVNQRFQEIVTEAIATDEILLAAGISKKGVALERNRRLGFVRTNLHTVRRWLRAPGHDLMKLDATKVSKPQLLSDAPPANKHALTRRRAQAKADKQIAGLLVFLKQLAKSDQAHASAIAAEAVKRFAKLLTADGEATTDIKQAVKESRPYRMGGDVYWLAEGRAKAA